MTKSIKAQLDEIAAATDVTIDEDEAFATITRRFDRGRRARTGAAAALATAITVVVLIVGFGVASRPSPEVEVGTAAQPAEPGASTTAAPTSSSNTPSSPPTTIRGAGSTTAVAKIAGTNAGIAWEIVPSRGGPTGTSACWQLVTSQPLPERCGFGVPDARAIGVEVEKTTPAALVWGPISNRVSRVTINHPGQSPQDARIVTGSEGTQFFVADSPLGVAIDEVVAYDNSGAIVESLPIGSAPCPC